MFKWRKASFGPILSLLKSIDFTNNFSKTTAVNISYAHPLESEITPTLWWWV